MDFKKTIVSTLFACLLLSSAVSIAQQENEFTRCATDEYNKMLLKNYPNMMGSEAYEKKLNQQIQLNKIKGNSINGTSNRRGIFTIPVVVHVIHNGEAIGVGPNISDAQVLSQIQVLNEDFRRILGTNGHNTHPDGADVEVEFCLAQQTPDGCITNGINRVDMSSVNTSWSGPGGSTDTVLKPATIWDSSLYMNMWSVNFSDNTLLGFAQFPGGAANTDGVVAGYQFFGTDEDPNVTIPGDFNLGRTMTHEVGHYLGLYHTFQGGCNEAAGDFCADTPAVASSSSNTNICNTGNDSCTTPPGLPDMVENYMDYSQDSCMNVFTNDQKARVVATLTVSANRPTTLSSSVCTPLASVNDDSSVDVEGIAVEDCGVSITPSVRITNWGTVTLTSAVISYDEDGGTASNYNWSGSLNNGEFEVVNLPTIISTSGNHTFNASISSPNGNTDLRSCNDDTSAAFNVNPLYSTTTQVHLTLITDNFGNETTWEFSKSSGGTPVTGGPYGDNTTINLSLDVDPSECYTFTIFDSQDDGICCAFGAGSYELKADDDSIIASGGNFVSSESTRISTVTLTTDDYFTNKKVSVYPNPTEDILNIKLANGNDLPDAYKVYNLLGQLVNEKQVNHVSQLKVDVFSLSNGLYFIKVIKNGASLSLPFIKK